MHSAIDIVPPIAVGEAVVARRIERFLAQRAVKRRAAKERAKAEIVVAAKKVCATAVGRGSARGAHCDEPFDHAARVGTAVAVVAEEDDACLRELVRTEATLERGLQSLALGQVAVQIADQHDALGRGRVAGVRGGRAHERFGTHVKANVLCFFAAQFSLGD